MNSKNIKKIPAFSIDKNLVGKDLALSPAELLIAPASAFVKADLEPESGFVALFKKYLLLPSVIFICMALLRQLMVYENLRQVVLAGIAYPAAFVMAFTFLLYLVGVIAEETAELWGGRFSPGAGFRLAVISAWPVFMSLSIAILPVVNVALPAILFCYQIWLIKKGGELMLNVPLAQNAKWFISLLYSFVLLLALFLFVGGCVIFLSRLF